MFESPLHPQEEINQIKIVKHWSLQSELSPDQAVLQAAHYN